VNVQAGTERRWCWRRRRGGRAKIGRGRLLFRDQPKTAAQDGTCAALESARGVEGRAIGAERPRRDAEAEAIVTSLQFYRWRVFSKGLVAAYHATERRKKRLLEEMEEYFAFIENEGWWRGMRSWDESEGDAPYAGDFFYEQFAEYDHSSERREDAGRFHSQLSAAIRAGLDVASEPSAGVLGFTVGDVRTALGRNLPDWFCQLYPGIEKADDSKGVWL